MRTTIGPIAGDQGLGGPGLAAAGPAVPARAAEWAAELGALRARYSAVTIAAGAEATAGRLAAVVRAARDAGFRAVGLRAGADSPVGPGDLADLTAAGLTDLHLALYGPRPEVHDFHVGRPGGFKTVTELVARAASTGLQVAVDTPVTRSNFRELAALPGLLGELGATVWGLSVLAVEEGGWAAAETVVPRFGMAVPHLLRALQLARRAGLPAWVRGAPLCTLGPFAGWACPAERRAFAAVCDGCRARPSCPGVDPGYLDRFGGGELRAVEPVEEPPDWRPLRELLAGSPLPTAAGVRPSGAAA